MHRDHLLALRTAEALKGIVTLLALVGGVIAMFLFWGIAVEAQDELLLVVAQIIVSLIVVTALVASVWAVTMLPLWLIVGHLSDRETQSKVATTERARASRR